MQDELQSLQKTISKIQKRLEDAEKKLKRTNYFALATLGFVIGLLVAPIF